MTARRPAQVRDASGLLQNLRVPTHEHTYSALELFLFSAATWNPHRVHYDQDYTRSVAGEPQLLVQGPLQAAHMFQWLQEHLPAGIAIRAFEYRHRAVLHAGEPVRIGGRLLPAGPPALAGLSAGQVLATVEMWVESAGSGQRTTTGLAHVGLGGPHPRQAAGPTGVPAQESGWPTGIRAQEARGPTGTRAQEEA